MLLQNAVFIPEDDFYLVSSHVHDFITYTFKDGKTISVDGGAGPGSYARRAGDFGTLNLAGRYSERCLTTEDPFDHVIHWKLWGTRGKAGDQPLRYRPIAEFAPEHLQAILDNCPARSPVVDRVVRYWLAFKTKTQVPTSSS